MRSIIRLWTDRKFNQKLVLSFLIVALLIVVVAYFSIHTSQHILKKSIGEDSVVIASELIRNIDREIYQYIESFQAYSDNLSFQEQIRNSNLEFAKLDNIQNYIDKQDREWVSASSEELTPFMKQLINNMLAVELRKFTEFYEEKHGLSIYGEIIITNKYGANIAQTGKTTDYRQDDELWWQTAKEDGLYVADKAYDESAGLYSLDVGIRVDDEEGNFLGVTKAVLNIEAFIRLLKELEGKVGLEHRFHGHSEHETMEFKLITKYGKIIYSTEDYALFDDVSELFTQIKEAKEDMQYAIAEGDMPGEEEELFAYAQSKGYMDYKGLGWFLIVEHETDEIFATVNILRNRIIIASLSITIIAVIMGLFASRSIAKPILKLKDAMNKVGKGNLDVQIAVQSDDEIGQLSKTFQEMAEELKSTTVKRDDLAKEIVERKKAEDQLKEKQEELVNSNEELNSLFLQVERVKKEWENTMDCMEDMVIVIDKEEKVLRCNKALRKFTGMSYDEIIGTDWLTVLNGCGLETDMFYGRGFEFFHNTTGRSFVLNSNAIEDLESKEDYGMVITLHDTTELKSMTGELEKKNRELEKAYAELKATQARILQQEKMASIGQLAAGVAHEINNPIGFVSSNLGTLGKYTERLTEFVDLQAEALESSGKIELTKGLEEKKKKLKIDYIADDIKDLVKESLDGTDRVKKIVQDLKSFSRVDEAEYKDADINECLESTLNIAWNELKYKATVKKEYGEIPQTKCYPLQINQVFMNLLINAAQAIEKQGEIIIKTWNGDGSIKISIADTGCGIPRDKINRIFEPFYTSKEVGKGTGLGLGIAYDIIKKHNGEIEVESEEGKGTTFILTIPVTE